MESGLQLKLLMLAIWLGFIAFSVKKFIRGRASTNWPNIAASVNSSDIQAKSAGNGLTFYSPVIEYQFSVNNKIYKSSNFTFMGTSGLTKKCAEKYINMYPSGSEVNIFYNPRKPEVSVIIPGVHWWQYGSMLFLTLMFFGIANIVEILNLIWPGCEPNCT